MVPSLADDVSWPVAAERLVIRPVDSADIRAMWRYRRLPEVGEWLTSYPTDEREFVSRYDDPERREKTLAVLLRYSRPVTRRWATPGPAARRSVVRRPPDRRPAAP